MMENTNRDIWIGGTAIAIAGFGWFVVIPIGVDVPSSVKILALSPDFWPRIIMGMMAACGLVVLAQGFLARQSDDNALQSEPDDAAEPASADKIVHFETRGQFVRVAMAFAGLFAFYFAVPYIGVVIGAMIIILLSTRFLGVKSWLRAGLLAVIMPVALYFFFTEVAQIPIPLGLFEEMR
ncbi:MAG: tripartite tricarboxylate transporter TctB family protein [Rhodospirillales bacterium]|jgi:hypothetical protein